MKQHLLSIIIPIYNAEKYLSDCLESVINQNYKNIEILLIDDGSTDCSGIICDKYKCKDSRVKVIHKKNEGCSVARNIGIKEAKGDLIAFVDADDVIDCQIYEILIRNLDVTNSDLSACAYKKEYDRGRILSKNIYEVIPKPLIFENRDIFVSVTRSEKSIEGYIWNKVWKKEIIDEHLFRENIVMCEDSIFSWEVLKNVKRVSYCDLPLYHYFIQPLSATRNSSIEKYLGALTSYELMLEDVENLPKEVELNLTKEYLGWNLLVFNKLIKQYKPDMILFNKIKKNCGKKKEYIHLLRPASRICAYSLTMGGYYQAKIIAIILENLLKIKNTIKGK